MGKQANPDRIRQFQQDVELLNRNGWRVTMIAIEMGVNTGNLSAYVNFREVPAGSKKIGKRPGSDTINKFYSRFQLEIERLKPGPGHFSRENSAEFNEDERQRRIRELEESKKFLEEQMAFVISNNTTLANTNAALTNNILDLTSNNGDLSKAFVELALQAKNGGFGQNKSPGE